MYPIIKKIFRRPDILRLSVLCFVLQLLYACNTRVEGCLDVDAQNFDLDADRACDGCCKYPPILLSLSQKWDQENFNTKDTFFDVNLRPYKILDLKFVLSSFSWWDVNGQSYTIDSSSISCESAIINYTRDILIIEPERFQYTLDSIKKFPSITNLKLKLGWSPDLSCIDPYPELQGSVFADENPLWDSLGNARSAIRLIIQPDLNTENTDTLYIHACKEIQIPYEHTFVPGQVTQLDLSVNYAQWFRSVNVTDLNSFAASLLLNLEGSIHRTL